MSAQLRFLAPRFVVANEEAEGVEKVESAESTGESAVLAWLAERLTTLGLVRDAQVLPAGETWGLDVEVFGEPYKIGCDGHQEARWVLIVAPRRSVIDRLLGRRELTADDALLRIVVELLERQPDFSSIELIID